MKTVLITGGTYRGKDVNGTFELLNTASWSGDARRNGRGGGEFLKVRELDIENPVALASPSNPAKGFKVTLLESTTIEVFGSDDEPTEAPADEAPATITILARVEPVADLDESNTSPAEVTVADIVGELFDGALDLDAAITEKRAAIVRIESERDGLSGAPRSAAGKRLSRARIALDKLVTS